MNTSKTWQIAIVLILTCNFALQAAEEPNDPNDSQIKIEISDEVKPWNGPRRVRLVRGKPVETYDQVSIRPTYKAEGFVRIKDVPCLLPECLLKTSAAAAMSEKQQEFMEESTEAFIFIGPSTTTGPQRYFELYAVSEADARKMVEVLIEILGEGPKQIRLEYARRLREAREEMAKAKGLLPGKEALLPSVKAEYDKSKESSHPFLADTEAADQAKQTIVEMGKMLDTLDVELAGIREKLKVIQDYWTQEGEWTKEALAKLQELQIIQTIELKGAEAGRKAAVAIRQREKDFLDLFDKWTSLESEIDSLRSTIRSREERISKYEETLANPKPDMLPPKIYENKVVIYPVAEQKDTPEEE